MEATRLHALMLLARESPENRGDFQGFQLRAFFSLFCSHGYLIGHSLKNFSAQRPLVLSEQGATGLHHPLSGLHGLGMVDAVLKVGTVRLFVLTDDTS